MARLARIDSPSSYSGSDRSRSITLKDSLQLVVDQKLDGPALFNQSPKEIRELLDQVSRQIFKGDFPALKGQQHCEVCKLLLEYAKE